MTITEDALTICNSCEAAPMVPGDPAGYCAGCKADALAAGADLARCILCARSSYAPATVPADCSQAPKTGRHLWDIETVAS